MFSMCVFLWLLVAKCFFSRNRKLLFPHPYLLYNRRYNVALPWQRLFRYIISVLVAILRLTDIGKKTKIAILATDTICIGTSLLIICIYVYTVCKLILVHQLVLYCCLPDAASHLRPFHDSRGVPPPPPPPPPPQRF